MALSEAGGGRARTALSTWTHLTLWNPYTFLQGVFCYHPISQLKKLRLRELKQPAQGHS